MVSCVVALGISNGANIAVGLLLGQSGLLRGAALLRPMLPYEPEITPELTGTDVLIAAGERDPYAPPAMTEQLEHALTDAGATVRTTVAAAGHEMTQSDLESARAWMRELMGQPG